MCNAVVVIVVVATFFTVSVLFYSVVFAFSLLLLLLLYVLLFYLARGNTTRCHINKPALACRPQKPLQQQQQQLGNWELQQQNTHTHCRVVSCVLRVWCACVYFAIYVVAVALLLLLFNFSLFQTLTHTHRHNSHIDTRLFANQLARCKICYSIFEKTLYLQAYAKWLATTTINNHFFPYSKIYFKWEYQQQKTHTR